MPVMAMDYLRLPVQARQYLQNGSTEEEKTFQPPFAIYLTGIGEIITINQINLDLIAKVCSFQSDWLDGFHYPYIEIINHGHHGIFDGINDAIPRHHHAHIVSQFTQSFRQRTDNIGQPTYLGQWSNFSSNKEDFHSVV
ncbi:hypothetical protein ES703_72256 [subsurface metagenome]